MTKSYLRITHVAQETELCKPGTGSLKSNINFPEKETREGFRIKKESKSENRVLRDPGVAEERETVIEDMKGEKGELGLERESI